MVDTGCYLEGKKLHQEFSTAECTYQHQNSCVIYSPTTNESILCKKDVLEFLLSLEGLDDIEVVINKFVQQNSEYGFNVIKQLVTMKILVDSNRR
ncbi:hypothetical protein [Vibrio sp. HN007]|uniref:hypothetical protein n=1 Tax=Vibrio iocasae TaxID=3098914 RepID=UPI0035D51D5F